AVVLLGNTERLADLGQRRQHRIDCERDQRLNRGDQADELAKAHSGVAGGLGLRRRIDDDALLHAVELGRHDLRCQRKALVLDQCATWPPRTRPLSASWASIWAISRSSPGWSRASARATRTSWVLDARSSHQPSAVLTRAPSVRSTLAPAASSRSSTSSTTANLRLSST